MSTLAPFRKTLLGATLTACVVIGSPALFAQTSSSTSTQSSNQTVPDKAADGWITTKVKSEFAANKGVHATDISVSTTEGKVTLTGTVASAHEKAKATKLARSVKGVKSVDASGLTVQAASGDADKSMSSGQ
jgi:hyperosmotically inducible protein